jgi:hypothetical protein
MHTTTVSARRTHVHGHAHAAQGGRRRTLPLRAPFAYALPARVELGTFSKAGGPWTVDWARAQRDALAALAQIDFSRRDLILWIPGTDGHGVHQDVRHAVDYLYGEQGGDESLTYMPYEASWALRESLPTGLATMKLVLEGIRQRLATMPAASRPRVLLAGESQGAWIIGEALADPSVGGVVTRAALVGHPWLARTQYLDGHDPRVRVINHRGDQIAMEIKGDAGIGMDAMTAVKTGKLKEHLGLVAKAILANPIHGALLAHTMARDAMPVLRPFLRDPHVYGSEWPRMVRFLRDGVLDETDTERDDRERGRPPSSFIG